MYLKTKDGQQPNPTTFVANLYLRLLKDEVERPKQWQEVSSSSGTLKTARVNNGYLSQISTARGLSKNNIQSNSQTSLGGLGYGQKSQGAFAQVNTNHPNFIGVQPSYVPSVKSLKSLNSCGGGLAQSSSQLNLSQRPNNFNNTQIVTSDETAPFTEKSPTAASGGRVLGCIGGPGLALKNNFVNVWTPQSNHHHGTQ